MPDFTYTCPVGVRPTCTLFVLYLRKLSDQSNTSTLQCNSTKQHLAVLLTMNIRNL